MKLLLTTAAVAALLSTGAFAQQVDQGQPSGQMKQTGEEAKGGGAGGMGPRPAASGSMNSGTTGAAQPQQGGLVGGQDIGKKDQPAGQKTGVEGGK